MPVIHFSRLPPLFCLSLGAFLGVVLTAFVLGQRASQKHFELASNYGNALVGLVAQDAGEPTVSHNLLSLHALMSSVVALPRVQLASVYSVEQALLAQAGKPISNSPSRVFTAPIPLHDSTAGHVSISLDIGFGGEKAFRWVLLAVAVLLMLMAGLALYEARAEVFYWPPKVPNEPPVGDDLHSEPVSADALLLLEEGLPADGPESVPVVGGTADWCHSDLVVALPNFSRLEKQLSDIVFSRRVAQFERQFKGVLSIYNGYQVDSPSTHGVYCLRLKSHVSLSEAVFSAICSACLIRSLECRHKIKFDFLAAVCSRESDVKLSDSIRGIFVQKCLLDDFLRERLILEEAQEDYMLVTGLHQQYASLLERQAEQLQPLP